MNEVEKEQRQARFRSDLQELLNRHSRENESNTPDYMLADYLVECLRSLDEVINRRASWYGRFDKPGANMKCTACGEPYQPSRAIAPKDR